MTEPSQHNTSESSQDIRELCWTRNHYSFKDIDNTKRYLCLAPNCTVNYARTVSRKTLRAHWTRNHVAGSKSVIQLDPESHIDKLLKFIISERKPFRIVDSPTFRDFAHSMDPNKQIPCSKTVSRQVRIKVEPIQTMVVKELSRAAWIGLTFDIWTSMKQSTSFACVTGHFVNADFSMASLVLEFDLLRFPHTGQVIAEFLRDVILRYKIQDKVISITTDNASNNISALSRLKQMRELSGVLPSDFLHIRCMAHVINIAVGDALKRLDLIIKPIKELVKNIRSSPSRTQQFRDIQMDLESGDFDEPLNLIDSTPTRWNSTFKMLERVLTLKEAILQSSDIFRDLNRPIDINWDLLKLLVDFLEPFNDATEELSGSKYPAITTACLIMHQLVSHSSLDFGHVILNDAGASVRDKLQTYSAQVSEPLVIAAAVLDPRIKLSFLKDQAYGRDILKRLVDGQQMTENTPQRPKRRKILSEFFISVDNNEVDQYSLDSRALIEEDICNYWSTKTSSYPKLSSLVRKAFSMQITSVASERLFSLASMIDEVRRNRLSRESFRSTILINSWLEFFKVYKTNPPSELPSGQTDGDELTDENSSSNSSAQEL